MIKLIIKRRSVLILFHMNKYTQHTTIVNNGQLSIHSAYAIHKGRSPTIYIPTTVWNQLNKYP